MEHHRPKTPLERVKALVKEDKVRVTQSAINGAHDLGLGVEDIYDAILNLTREDFYKRMTSHADHKIWHEVYTPIHPTAGELYLKVIVQEDCLVVSFKERQP
ncbi:hypothetical protein ATN89_17300 [Comamonas thiooxydans]|uniref:type II toxin-antitoxin system MqsR family toxin n=1 Tax=Comamonas thiooxydans TaxID=363952 RepID=UPI0007C51784|nr:type II toxin-antitoxin system MqsR family toxin [Comamonas thiooxydans]OAD82840.1 hypothetical protein ATN89_17300 [Comamonas thiooxydans]